MPGFPAIIFLSLFMAWFSQLFYCAEKSSAITNCFESYLLYRGLSMKLPAYSNRNGAQSNADCNWESEQQWIKAQPVPSAVNNVRYFQDGKQHKQAS